MFTLGFIAMKSASSTISPLFSTTVTEFLPKGHAEAYADGYDEDDGYAAYPSH